MCVCVVCWSTNCCCRRLSGRLQLVLEFLLKLRRDLSSHKVWPVKTSLFGVLAEEEDVDSSNFSSDYYLQISTISCTNNQVAEFISTHEHETMYTNTDISWKENCLSKLPTDNVKTLSIQLVSNSKLTDKLNVINILLCGELCQALLYLCLLLQPTTNKVDLSQGTTKIRACMAKPLLVVFSLITFHLMFISNTHDIYWLSNTLSFVWALSKSTI